MSGYGNEFTRENNPLACGLANYCELDGSVDFLGRETLRRIACEGHQREMRSVLFDGGAWSPCGEPWPVMAGKADGPRIGQITSAAWSPHLKHNVGLSMVERLFWQPGQTVTVRGADGLERPRVISALPFD